MEIFPEEVESAKQIAAAEVVSGANVAVIHLFGPGREMEIGRVFVAGKRHRRQSTFHFSISIYLIHAITR